MPTSELVYLVPLNLTERTELLRTINAVKAMLTALPTDPERVARLEQLRLIITRSKAVKITT